MRGGDGSRTLVVLVDGGAEVVLGELAGPCADLAVVDGLARLQLLARRLGCSICVRHPSEELRDLLALVGLADVIAGCGSALQAGGEAERGEQLRVQEVVEPGDPPA